MSKPDQPSAEAHFFGLFLTFRQLLTRRPLPALLIACACLVLPVGYFYQRPQTPEDTGATTSVASPRLLKVVTREISAAGPAYLSQRFTGIVTPRRATELAAKTTGRVVSIAVDLGDPVRQGQLLLELDHGQLDAEHAMVAASLSAARAELSELTQGPRRQDIEQAEARVSELEANLQLSRSNFQRTKALRASSAISIQEYDESRFALDATTAQLESAHQALEQLREGTRLERIDAQRAKVDGLAAQLRRAEADLADQRVLAPFSGVVQRRAIDEGSVVAPGQVLLQIVESAPFEVRVGLPTSGVRGLSESNLLLTIGDQKLAAKIDRIAPSIHEATRTREVVLLLSEASSRLVDIGTAVSVVVQQPVESQGYWVPTHALTAGARGLWAVYVAIPSASTSKQTPPASNTVHVIERRQVELLRAHGEWSEIRGPLSPGEQLVIDGVHRITPGQRVEPVSSEQLHLAGAE